MGSFRIVIGTGYGRHEITRFRNVQREFSRLREVAKLQTPPTVTVRKTRTSRRGVQPIYDKLWDGMVKKANKWARETAAAMRANVPVDTGNLRDSIHVLEDKCIRVKSTGQIVMVVGVDLDPYGGRGKLYAPPLRKKSPKHGRKHAPWQGYRVMPRFPNDYSFKYIDDTRKRFSAISKNNARKIMGK